MKNVDLDINVHYITRVEGHGNVVVKVKEGELKECRWEIPEAPRFFEAMVRGRKWPDISQITSRICGICSVGHTTASLRATEKALDVEISEQTLLLRKLLLHGETLQSHVLHVYFLAVPDLLGAGSVIPLAESHTDAVKMALRMKKFANDMCDLFGGRTVHPITPCVGGFTEVPTVDQLVAWKKRTVEEFVPDAKATLALLKTLPMPPFDRETEYISLHRDDEYAFYDGQMMSSDTGCVPEEDYLGMTNEFVVPHSFGKWTKHNRDSLAVGALARTNNNFELLSPMAKDAAAELGLTPHTINPFMNNVAQFVECVHCAEDSLKLLDQLIETGIDPALSVDPPITPKAGRGVACVEVPRGILVHDYTYSDDGEVVAANCVIPTNQNHNNIERDFEAYVPQLVDEGKDSAEVQQHLEMLVRSYDPCISCSVHLVEL